MQERICVTVVSAQAVHDVEVDLLAMVERRHEAKLLYTAPIRGGVRHDRRKIGSVADLTHLTHPAFLRPEDWLVSSRAFVLEPVQ